MAGATPPPPVALACQATVRTMGIRVSEHGQPLAQQPGTQTPVPVALLLSGSSLLCNLDKATLQN